jgi:cephalosporin hydroxylase
MSESVGTKVGSRSSNAFLRVVAALAVALACAEFLVAIHYHDRWVAAQSLRNVADEFQTFYYGSSIWSKTRWLGIRSEQAPTDNWSMQEIICEIRPDYIIETGTMNGGTTLF